MDPNKHWGDSLKEIRTLKGMSQYDLAKVSGVARVAISRVENGRLVELKLSSLLALAEALDTSLDELVGRRKVRSLPVDTGNPIQSLQEAVKALPPEGVHLLAFLAESLCQKWGVPEPGRTTRTEQADAPGERSEDSHEGGDGDC